MFASLLEKLSARNRRPVRSTSHQPTRSRRFQLEALEDRTLLSSAPYVYSVLDDRVQAAGHTLATAQTVNLMPMMESQVVNNLSNALTTDLYKIQLKKGQVVTASADAFAGFAPPAPPGIGKIPVTGPWALGKIALWDATGHELISGDNTQAPATNPSLNYRVQQDGTYYVLSDLETSPVFKGLGPLYSSPDYVLNIRPIGLNQAMQDPSWLNRAGGELDVWLDGNVLDVSGPAGHGFGIRGNWRETSAKSGANYTSTYVASGNLYLQTAVGDIGLTVPSGSLFSVTTQASPWGQYFGALASMTGTFTLSLNDLASSFGQGSAYGLGLSAALPQGGWGIKLGSDLTNTGAPLDAAIPYLYCITGSDPSLSFGGVNVSVKNSGVDASVVADPADPFLYTGVKGIPESYVPDFAFAGSAHGLIPFVPVAQPSHYPGTVYGQVFNSCKIDLSDAGIPVTIDGDFTWNFDANHTGKVLGGAFSNVGDMVTALRTDPSKLTKDTLHRLDTAFHNLSFGHNGTGSIGFDKSGFSFEIPAVHDSDIFDGPAQTYYLHGGSVDPLKGTPLANLIKNDVDMDGYFTRSGRFDVSLSGDLALLWTTSKGTIELSNAGAHVDGAVNALGMSVQVHGDVKPNGDYDLSGQGDVDFYLAHATGNFDVKKQNGQSTVSVRGQLNALGSSVAMTGQVYANGDFTLTGEATGNFFLANATADLTFKRWQGATSFHVDARVNVLGATVEMIGDVQPNGDFDCYGGAQVNLIVVNATASFDFGRHAGMTSIAAHLHAHYDAAVIRGDIDADLTIQADVSGRSTFSGSGSVSVEAYYPQGGWNLFNWQWQPLGSLGLGVSNDTIWFTVNVGSFLHQTVSIALPH